MIVWIESSLIIRQYSKLSRRRFLSARTIFLEFVLIGIGIAIYPTAQASPPSNCSSQHLAGSASLQGENGFEVGKIILKNTSPESCRIPKQPKVFIYWHGTKLNVHQIDLPELGASASSRSGYVYIAHGQVVRFGLVWGNWCKSYPSRNSVFKGSLLVSLYSTSIAVQLSLTSAEIPRCDFPEKPSTLSIANFEFP